MLNFQNGNSGVKLELLQINGRPAIKKTAFGVEALRLKQSCRIQKKSFLRTPLVLEERDLEGAYSFSMEYINGLCGSQIGEFSDIESQCSLKEFFKNYASSILNLPTLDMREQFHAKIKSLQMQKVEHQIYHEALHSLSEIIGQDGQPVLCPKGNYHGDLTLSNIIINKESPAPYFIDFLPSYAPTPLLDIAKMEQDLIHRWSFRHHSLRSSRSDIVLFELTPHREIRLIDEQFQSLKLIRILNLLRIFPYISDERTEKWCLISTQNEMKKL